MHFWQHNLHVQAGAASLLTAPACKRASWLSVLNDKCHQSGAMSLSSCAGNAAGARLFISYQCWGLSTCSGRSVGNSWPVAQQQVLDLGKERSCSGTTQGISASGKTIHEVQRYFCSSSAFLRADKVCVIRRCCDSYLPSGWQYGAYVAMTP